MQHNMSVGEIDGKELENLFPFETRADKKFYS